MKTKKRRRSGNMQEKRSPEKEQSQQEERTASSQQPEPPSHPPIRKGIYLSPLIYVEGEQPPAENFDPVAIDALRDVLSSCFSREHDGLKMSLKSIDVRNDIEQEDEEEAAEKEGKFQF
jgi:hypothetical protein